MKLVQQQAVVFLLMCAVMAAQTSPTTFHAETNVVLVPALVLDRKADIVYGLSAEDFTIEDDGVTQPVHMHEAPLAEPISLIVAIQTGRSAPLHFVGKDEKATDWTGKAEECRTCTSVMSGLGTMLDSFLGESQGEVAVVTFDSQVKLLQSFTGDMGDVSRELRSLAPGDSGAAIRDAVRYSLELFRTRPKTQRHVLLLISEMRDHGSRTSVEDVVQRLTVTNTVVYSVTFSPARAEFMRDLRGKNQSTGAADLLRPIVQSVNGMKKNVARPLAEMSGGEYRTFKSRRTFEEILASAATHTGNRYLLSFQPKQPRPGPHVIRVTLKRGKKDRVIARTMYWAVGKAD